MTESNTGAFTSSLGCLIQPALADLAAQFDDVPQLGAAERLAIADGVGSALYETVHRKLCRTLILELNAARVAGKLKAADSASRWTEFLALSGESGYWKSLGEHYPTMLPRIRGLLARRCEAAAAMAARVAADRAELTALTGERVGELLRVQIGAGDSHRGGQSVAICHFRGGTVVYKPRSVRVDQVLGEFLAAVLDIVPVTARIKVPDVLCRDDYGWTEFIDHRYCASDAELGDFYQGIGQWLAVMSLLGGSDLHAENVIACGPVPVVVDCETLFTPLPPTRPSGLGLAMDQASRMISSTVLRIGMLPNRGVALGFRGVDSSSAGALPGQQPVTEFPVIVGAGTDQARFGYQALPRPPSASHPSPAPALVRYWERVLASYSELTTGLIELDRAGGLDPLLRPFANCGVRVVLRATEIYSEIARMLWHPVSLHEPAGAADRAAELLARNGEAVPGAPTSPEVIAAEVSDLLAGDIPYFATSASYGMLSGPGGTTWLAEQDLVAATLDRWRETDLDLERQVIKATLVSAYLNEGLPPLEGWQRKAAAPDLEGLDRRRRNLAAELVRRLDRAAIRGDDGTVTWIAPVLSPVGWAVEPLYPDAYAGLSGLALVIAAYVREAQAGRADEVVEMAGLLGSVLRTMRAADDSLHRQLDQTEVRLRPLPVGGYIGLGSQLWSWLTLHQWGAASDGLARARALAELVPAAIAADASYDLLTGMAGVIVPLLKLAAMTGEHRWLAEAVAVGRSLAGAARWDSGTAYWTSPRAPTGLGGFAHGTSGIGWALARLALVTGDDAAATTAQAAFAFEESLYQDGVGWRDLRDPSGRAADPAWCHGSVGIGLSALDLRARGWELRADIVSRALSDLDRHGLGANHTLCHGDTGCWELLDSARSAAGCGAGADRDTLVARVIGSLEVNDPITGLTTDAFSPGLLSGLGGIAYQLLRMHEASDLPSVLIQDAADGPRPEAQAAAIRPSSHRQR